MTPFGVNIFLILFQVTLHFRLELSLFLSIVPNLCMSVRLPVCLSDCLSLLLPNCLVVRFKGVMTLVQAIDQRRRRSKLRSNHVTLYPDEWQMVSSCLASNTSRHIIRLTGSGRSGQLVLLHFDGPGGLGWTDARQVVLEALQTDTIDDEVDRGVEKLKYDADLSSEELSRHASLDTVRQEDLDTLGGSVTDHEDENDHDHDQRHVLFVAVVWTVAHAQGKSLPAEIAIGDDEVDVEDGEEKEREDESKDIIHGVHVKEVVDGVKPKVSAVQIIGRCLVPISRHLDDGRVEKSG